MLDQEIEISNDDVSVLGNDDEPTNYSAVQNGVGDDEYNNGYNFVSALALYFARAYMDLLCMSKKSKLSLVASL